ncbi:AMP-binding protein [Gilvimarinus sp. DA14]|uniref:AMP-binding protein n=1 Tax=Gilvimarinus sp. DA14 TaxID=2956798 RepID=UPI0020B82CED|nr:AMP-binding protein [Gilvimarinus sp. DA14]UTF59725.1 AMP-binding protein [Gilvimarinus sp. DA14]
MDCKPSINLRKQGLFYSEQVLAYRGEDAITRADFCRQLQAYYRALRVRPEHRVCLWLSSGVDFLAAVLALAMAGKRTVMPHNLQPQSARELEPHFDALITDTPIAEIDCPQWSPAELSALNADDNCVDEEALTRPAELLLFTSGSTGAPEPVVKKLTDFEHEIAALNLAFADNVGSTTVAATVSHQHIYGLLHVLFWPLARGASFIDGSCHFPELLASYAEQHKKLVLVSSPTHLTRLPLSEEFVASAKSYRAIFSSGGLLTPEAALAMAGVCDKAPLEILGSTETGGVAWRCQTDGPLWQPLPGVQIMEGEAKALVVSAAHVGQAGRFTMGDCITLQGEGCFALLGRKDKIVKVEGKRLSLTELERRLAQNALVHQASAAILKGKRDEVVALVSLAEPGREYLAARGKRALNQLLREYLRQYFEAPLLPRRWRYVAELPRNSQGKLPQNEVLKLFHQEGA